MIRYSLACDGGHEFEGWFGSSDEFERQSEEGLLECPFCGSADITKMLMAPSVATSRQREATQVVAARAEAIQAEAMRAEAMPAHAGETPEGGVPVQLAGLSNEQREIVSQMRDLKAKLLASSEDVGDKFSEEARKIHYGEAEERGIYGHAKAEDAADLVEEGIPVYPLPDLPEDRN